MKKTLVLVGLLFLIESTFAQSTNTPPPYPFMHVMKKDGELRRAWFMNNKYDTLCTTVADKHETESIICPYSSIYHFIDSIGKDPEITNISFVFAAYKEGTIDTFPHALADHLTLIVAPLKGKENNIEERGDFYNITSTGRFIKISIDSKKQWINNFVAKKMQVLVPALDQNDVENELNNISDTRYLIYIMKDFKEFLNEKKHQDDLGTWTTDGIEIDFCAYPDKGILDDKGGIHYRNRMITQFEYLSLAGTHHNRYVKFYIDEGNEIRAIQHHPWPKFYTGDNGLLCPANCPVPPNN